MYETRMIMFGKNKIKEDRLKARPSVYVLDGLTRLRAGVEKEKNANRDPVQCAQPPAPGFSDLAIVLVYD